jgi:hypothetical protein
MSPLECAASVPASAGLPKNGEDHGVRAGV